MKRAIRWHATGARGWIGQCSVEWREVTPQGAGAAAVGYEWDVRCHVLVQHEHGVCKRLRCARRAIHRVSKRLNLEYARSEHRKQGRLL
jgi:hypothetical protein